MVTGTAIKKGYKQTELGVIPEDWDVVRFADVADGFSSGQTPYRAIKKYYSGAIPWVTSGELNYNVITDTNEKITDEAVANTHLKILPIGTFLFAITGLEAEGTRGSCAITGIEATTNQSCMALYPKKDRLTTKYLYYYYVRYGNELAFEYCQGTKQQSYTARIAKQLPIILPPTIGEQEAIAAVLSDAAALIERLGKLIAKKKAIKQGTIQQLLTGKKRLPGFNDKWQSTTLGDLGKCLRGVSYKGELDLSPYDAPGTIRLLRSNNVQDALVQINDLQYVNEERVSKPQMMQPCDILICMANGSKELVGKAGIFSIKDGQRYTFGAFMGCFRTSPDSANPAFVFFLFQTERYRKYIQDLLSGSSINNLRPSAVESLEFAIPGIEEQNAIATILLDMDAEIDALKRKKDRYTMLKQGMMQQLLTGKIRIYANK